MKLGESHGSEDCRAPPGSLMRGEEAIACREVCSSSYEFRTKACKKRLQWSIHEEHSVKNETVMQAGTQSTRESKTQASSGSGQRMPSLEAQGFYSTGGEFLFAAIIPSFLVSLTP